MFTEGRKSVIYLMPFQVDLVGKNGLEDESDSDKKEMWTMRRRTAGRVEGDYCDMKPSLMLQNTEFSLAGEDLASIISFESLPSSSGASGEAGGLSQTGLDPRVAALLDSGLTDRDILSSLLQWSLQANSASRLRAGCLPYLINLLHLHPHHRAQARPDRETRCQALHVISNLINNNNVSEKRRKRESKVIGLLWLIRQYTDFLRDLEREAAMMVRAGQLGCSAVRLAAVKSSGIIKCGEWPRITPLY